MNWLWPLAASIAASTAALLGSILILILGERAERAAVWLLPFAIGTLLASATLGLLPEALEHAPVARVMPLFLVGIVAFIVIERALRWRHPHEPHPEKPDHPVIEGATATMILWGDALHNFVDGLVLGVSFAVDTSVGVAAALAIFAHEVPQEIGDFAILIGAGMPKRRALLLNYLSSAAVIPGTLLAFIWSSGSQALIAWLLPLAAGGFIYIALTDLVPSIHHRRGMAAGWIQSGLMVAGVAVIWAVSVLAH